MSKEMNTFQVVCAECAKTFTVRFALVDEAAEGTGEETVKCLFCKEEVIIPLERKYQKTGEILKSRKVTE